MKKVFSLLLVILLSNWAVAQYGLFHIRQKFNFYVANESFGRNRATTTRSP